MLTLQNLNFNKPINYNNNFKNSQFNKSFPINFKGLDKDEFNATIKTTKVNSIGVMNNPTFREIIEDFKKFPQVQAITIGGSQRNKMADKSSDIDLEIFVDGEIPVEERLKLVKKYSSNYEVGGEYFGPGDEFYVDKMGQQLDVAYFDKKWMEEGVENVWEKHQPSNGYTTCFLFTLENSQVVYDKDNWHEKIKERLNTPYPKELKQNIVKRNMMLLKDKPFASYYEQISKAISRNDINSVNHRIAAFMASYFDIIFANNELLHPGEKKLVKYANEHCSNLPQDFQENIEKLMTQPNENTVEILDDMISKLKNSISE